MIRVLLKNRNISRQTETGMYYISLQNVNQQIKAELFYLSLMKISCFKKNDSKTMAIFLLPPYKIPSAVTAITLIPHAKLLNCYLIGISITIFVLLSTSSYTCFFCKQCIFFFNSASMLLNFLMNWASNVAYVLLIAYKHDLTYWDMLHFVYCVHVYV